MHGDENIVSLTETAAGLSILIIVTYTYMVRKMQNRSWINTGISCYVYTLKKMMWF